MANMELISDPYAKKKYLGWSDKQVLSNREFLRKDAALSWELQQIAGAGPGWNEQQTAEADAIAGTPPVGAPGAGGPPAFGPGPTGDTPPPSDAGEADTDAPAPTPTDVSGPEDSALPT